MLQSFISLTIISELSRKPDDILYMETAGHLAKPKLERLWNINYIKALVGNFMLFFSFYILTPLLPIYLDEQFGADKDMIGIVLSGYVLAALIVRPFSAFLVDSFDRKRVLMIAFFIFFIVFTGYIGAGTVLMFAIVRTLHGLPFGAVTVANNTVAIDVLPSSRRNEGVGFYGLSNNLAMAIAPSIGIFIYGATDNFSLLFWIALATSFLGFICVSSIKTKKRVLDKATRGKISLDRFFLTKSWLLALNMILFGICWGIMSNYVAIYGKEELGMEQGTGVFFMLLSAGLFVSRLYGGKQLRQGRIVPNCLEGLIVSCIGYGLFAAFQTEWSFYLSALLIGLGNGHMYPAFLNMFVNIATPDRRGTATSSIMTSWDVGMGLGMLAGGMLLEYLNYDWAFWTCAVAQLAGTMMFIFFGIKFYRSRELH